MKTIIIKKQEIFKIIKKIACFFIIVGCLLVTISKQVVYAGTTPASPGIPVTDIGAGVRDVEDTIWTKISNRLASAAKLAYRNALNAFLGKIAYDSAVWLASGDPGQKPLIFSDSYEDYLLDAAESAAMGAIEGFATGAGFDAAGLCEPDPELKLKIGLALSLGGPTSPYKPTCTFAEFTGNWSKLYQDRDFDHFVSVQFDPAVNPIGQAISAHEAVKDLQEEAKENAKQTRASQESFKPVRDPVTGEILTTAEQVKEQQAETRKAAWDSTLKVWNDPIIDAVGLFGNTLISKLSQKLMAGLIDMAKGSDLADMLSGVSTSSSSGIEAASASYASFNQPVFLSSGTYDPLAEFTSCPGEDEGATSNNCIISSTLSTAISNKWTVQEFVTYLTDVQGNSEFKFSQADISTPDEGISYRGIVVLKKFRVVPVGWQLAAEYVRESGSTATLSQIVACYDNCGGDVTSDDTPCDEIKTIDGESTNYSPFCGLIDPNWVLKSSANYCEREAAGSDILLDTFVDDDAISDTLQKRTLTRADICADNRGCIQEEEENVCTAFGYCTEEQRIYRIKGSVCEEEYASCQSFTVQDGDEEGDIVSYLKNTLNYNDCATDPGCKWYCLAKDESGNSICKDQDTIYTVCNSDQASYYTTETCTCSDSEDCWVNPTEKTCTLPSTEECELDDNCGASYPTYSQTASQCLCTSGYSCTVEVDTDGDGHDSDTTNDISCTYTYDDSVETECDTFTSNCSEDSDTYVSQGYCSATGADRLGDNCLVKDGSQTCVNDLGNTCTLYQEEADGSLTTLTCGTDIATDTDDYCTCGFSLIDETCEITEGSYSCSAESGFTMILGTQEEGDVTPEGTDIVYNASINFDNNLEDCDSENASCSEFIRILPDTNILYNASFETMDDSNAANDTGQDYFGFYSLNGEPCVQTLDPSDPAYEGQCVGWEQNNVSAYAVNTDSEESPYTTIANEYGNAIIIPSASSADDSISNSFDTGYSLANRTFTFAYRAAQPETTGNAPKFRISTTDYDGAGTGYAVTIPDDVADADKANYDYYTDSTITNYSAAYTDYYYTVTFPDSTTATAIVVTIFAVDEPLAVDIAELSESEEWDHDYANYYEDNITYLKKDLLSCATEDIGCELYTPLDQEDAVAIPAQITNPNSAACGNGDDFSDPNCNQCTGLGDQTPNYYDGCDFFQEVPLYGNIPTVNYDTSLDTNALNGVKERTGYYCEGTQTSCYPGDSDGTCAGLGSGINCVQSISLIPKTAEECSVTEIGCEEYTNLDAVAAGGEGLEYYSYLKQCVKDTDTDVYTYHTWEGSDSEGYAMVLYTLKQSVADSGPCTHLDPLQETSNADCIDETSSSYAIEDCSPASLGGNDDYGINPDCVKFYDDSLNTYYRYKSQTIAVSADCKPFRNSLDQRIYYVLAASSETCDSSAVGCREYQGSESGNVEQVLNETFSENSTDNWTSALSTSNESLYTDDYSLRIDSGSFDDEEDAGGSGDATVSQNVTYNLYETYTGSDGSITYDSDVESSANYVASFWAKAADGYTGTLQVYLGGLSINYYFTDSGYTVDSADTATNIGLTGEWRHFLLGPMYLPSTENVEQAVFGLVYTGSDPSAKAYIDNIILEKNNDLYLIKNSFDTCYDYEGCRQYRDGDNNDHYLKSFNRLCEETAVDCEAMINTANSSTTEFTEIFLTENEFSPDDVIVPYDQVQPVIYDEDNTCTASAKGCTSLILPTLNKQTGVIENRETVYGLWDPDQYEILQCEDAQLDCREYYSEYDGTVYFKDPVDRLCELNSYTNSEGVSEDGWFIQDSESTTPDCPKQFSYASPSQPLGPLCNSNSGSKAGKKCNYDYDCYPDDGTATIYSARCISRPEDDIDQDTSDSYSLNHNTDFGWAGVCDEVKSGCSEYIDPMSPNITEELTNNSFENNAINNVSSMYFEEEGAVAELLPDYWVTDSDDDGVANWASDDGSVAECFEQDDTIYQNGVNSLKVTDECNILSADPIYVSRDESYTFEVYFKILAGSAKDSDVALDSYKDISVGAIFQSYDSDSESMVEVSATDEQKNFVADELTVDADDFTNSYADETDSTYSQWLRLSGNIGLGSTVEFPEGTEFVTLYFKVKENGSLGIANSMWFDGASFKENDKYYLIDYTVDGTEERTSKDGTHTCIDQDTEEEAITSDGGCVAFRDVLDSSQSYEQYGNTECTDCAISSNSDSCRYEINPCDTNAVFNVTKDRICSEWIGCETAEVVTDEEGNESYTCYSLQPCEKLNDEGRCTEWITKPVYERLDHDTDLTYYVHHGDADQVIDFRNITGYVKVGLIWSDYHMCEGGIHDGELCEPTDANACLDINTCTMNSPLVDATILNYQCQGGSLQGTPCNVIVEGEGGIARMSPDQSLCDGGSDNGTCTGVFMVQGYYPYGWMYEAGETGAESGRDLIEYSDFEDLYCAGKKINSDIPCVSNEGDTGYEGSGHCWQSSFQTYYDDETTGNEPIEGTPEDDNLTTADYYCPNSPAFTNQFPFSLAGDFTETGWSGYRVADDQITVTQYETGYGENLELDINNVLKVGTAEDPDAEDAESSFDVGVLYDLSDNIYDDGYYALSMKGRFTTAYNTIEAAQNATDGQEVAEPTLISMGLNHYATDGTTEELKYVDWFVRGDSSTDIVFVIDTSGSMGTAITAVKNAAPGLANNLAAQNIDFSFAVVDMEGTGSCASPTCVSVNHVVQDFTTDTGVFSTAVGSLVAAGTYVDTPDAVVDTINNALDSGTSLNYRGFSNKYLILVTDTDDEWATSGSSITDAEALAASANIPIMVITDSGESSYYSTMASNSNGYVFDGNITCNDGTSVTNAVECSDWSTLTVDDAGTTLVDAITNVIMDNIDYFQFDQELETYTFGPIQITQKGEATEDELNKTLTTDLIILENGTIPFEIDDVSLLPVLEINKDLDPITRTCRAYTNSTDVRCNYTERSGIQHKGWLGYCLEQDPENSNRCITWWPLDVIAGEATLATKEQGGYAERTNVYYCLAAKGYERPAFCRAAADGESYYDNPGNGVLCKPDDWDGGSFNSVNCGGNNCYYGSNFVIGGGGNDHVNVEEGNDYEQIYTTDPGNCTALVDDEQYACNAFPGSDEGECADPDCDNESDCESTSGSGCSSTWNDMSGYCSDDDYDNETDCTTASGTWTDTTEIDIIKEYGHTGECQHFEQHEITDGALTDGYYCFYDTDDDNIAEVSSDIVCYGNDSTCQLDEADPDDPGECTVLRCDGTDAVGCDPESIETDGTCQTDHTLQAYSDNYKVRVARWQMHDPYENLGENWGIITRIPATPTARNINFNEIEKIDLFLGSAGDGAGSTVESLFWGQGAEDASDADRTVTLTDLAMGGIYYDSEGNYEPGRNCQALRSSNAAGAGCRWWGQFDSEGQFNDPVEGGAVPLDDQEHKYDLVYTWVLGAFDRYTYCDDPSSGDNYECELQTSSGSPEKLKWRMGQLTALGEDEKDPLFESCCIDNSINNLMQIDEQLEHSDYTNNPWLVSSIQDEYGALDNDQDTDRSTFSRPSSNLFGEHTDNNTGGAVYSIYLNFDDNGYLEEIYTMVYDGYDNLADASYGVEVTRDKMIYVDYYLREPCAIVAKTVSASNDNTAWALRASGLGTLNFGNFAYDATTKPWGSISPLDDPFGSLWDSIDETSTDPDNTFLATAYGQQPILFYATDDDDIFLGGFPMSCIGLCQYKHCVGTGNEDTEGIECTDDNTCGSGKCVGIGNPLADGTALEDSFSLVNDGDYYNTFEEQLSAASSKGQENLEHIFADIIGNPYKVDYANQETSTYGIYTEDSTLWDTVPYNQMERCTDNIRDTSETAAGTDTEYCGIQPTVTEIGLDGITNSWTDYSVTPGQNVNLSFTTTVDGEQTELRKIYIDWGDGRYENINWDAIPGNHQYSHAYDCGPEYNALSYTPGVNCTYLGKIVVTDNWGWCSGDPVLPCSNGLNMTADDCTAHGSTYTAGTEIHDFRYIVNETDRYNLNNSDIISSCNSYDTFPFIINVELSENYD